ncbi:MAG: hypothetical protein V1835_04115 [Candidatus Micrarchaeota archaeon]
MGEIKIQNAAYASASRSLAESRKGRYSGKRHEFIPTDQKLLRLIGLTANDRIHYFSAYSGEWAQKLADLGARVDASDISKDIVARLKSNPGKIRRIFQAAGETGAIVPTYYDWSVSYEPFPIIRGDYGVNSLIRMGLINREGIKLIFSRTIIEPGWVKPSLKAIAKIYGADVEQKIVHIRGGPPVGRRPRQTRFMTVFTIRTNPKIRKKAELDLFLERRLPLLGDVGADSIKALANEFRVKKSDVVSGIARLAAAFKLPPRIDF